MNLYRLGLEDRTRERNKKFQKISQRDNLLLSSIIQEKFELEASPKIKILDFGCGKGNLVNYLNTLGFDANGCDITCTWEDLQGTPGGRFSIITMNP